MQHKDEALDRLARVANVAQFVSYGPDLEQRYAWLDGREPNAHFDSVEAAAALALAASADHSVNVRSYTPESPKSREFVYGLTRADDVASAVRRLAGDGLYTIINETIDIRDGGVSGVQLGGVLEFAPEDTPRCVEKPGTASLERALGLRLLETVYGFVPDLAYPAGMRVEFSIHPLRRGVRHTHTIIWELEDVGEHRAEARTAWPNRFSTFVGDKAFGLLMAHLAGLPVPRTTVIPRSLAPFAFGEDTGCREQWIRTCPRVQVPGKYTTKRGWLDPFVLMQAEDPDGSAIASVLAQQGVDARYSGAALFAVSDGAPVGGTLTIEGTAGDGEAFMVGRKARSALPGSVVRLVEAVYAEAAARFGPVRFEWVADAERVWVVQFHRGASISAGNTIVPGEATRLHRFEVGLGLEALRSLATELVGSGDGIVLVGDVGITSHFGDVLRKARIPSFIEPVEQG